MKHSAVLTTIFNERIDGRLFVGWLPFAFLPRHIIRRMKGDPTYIRNKSLHKQSCTKVNWNLLMNSSVIFYGTPNPSPKKKEKKNSFAATPSSGQIWNFMQKFPFLAPIPQIAEIFFAYRSVLGRLQASELRAPELPTKKPESIIVIFKDEIFNRNKYRMITYSISVVKAEKNQNFLVSSYCLISYTFNNFFLTSSGLFDWTFNIGW
jgi:hypothetical protein